MADYIGGRVTAFAGPPVTEPRKAQRVKLLEEAAEAFAAAQEVDAARDAGMPAVEVEMDLADELADTITACANLAARYGLDLQAALDRVERHNRERGRYTE